MCVVMGLLSILKKMKQKEKDVRILMLYPPLSLLQQTIASNFVDMYIGSLTIPVVLTMLERQQL